MRFEDTGGTFVFWLKKKKKKGRVNIMPSLAGHDHSNILFVFGSDLIFSVSEKLIYYYFFIDWNIDRI